MSEISIRVTGPEDAPALLDIYAYYVRHTAITFEYDVPSLEEFTARIRGTLEKYPIWRLWRTASLWATPTLVPSTPGPPTAGRRRLPFTSPTAAATMVWENGYTTRWRNV